MRGSALRGRRDRYWGGGDERLRPVVLDRVGPVAVAVQADQLVARAEVDEADQVAGLDPLDLGGEGEPGGDARARPVPQRRPGAAVDVHAGDAPDDPVVGEVAPVGAVGRVVEHPDGADGARRGQRVEQGDQGADGQVGPVVGRVRVEGAGRVEEATGVGQRGERAVGDRRRRDVEHRDLPGQRARGGGGAVLHQGQRRGHAVGRGLARVVDVGRRPHRAGAGAVDDIERPGRGRPALHVQPGEEAAVDAGALQVGGEVVDVALVSGGGGRAQPLLVGWAELVEGRVPGSELRGRHELAGAHAHGVARGELGLRPARGAERLERVDPRRDRAGGDGGASEGEEPAARHIGFASHASLLSAPLMLCRASSGRRTPARTAPAAARLNRAT